MSDLPNLFCRASLNTSEYIIWKTWSWWLLLMKPRVRGKKKALNAEEFPKCSNRRTQHKSAVMDLLLHLLITTRARHFTEWYKKFYNKQFRNSLPWRKMLFLSQEAELCRTQWLDCKYLLLECWIIIIIIVLIITIIIMFFNPWSPLPVVLGLSDTWQQRDTLYRQMFKR